MLDATRIRLDAINHVLALRERWVAVPASELEMFHTDSRAVHLKGPRGIFKPKELAEPLSILSTLDSPYNDALVEGKVVRYDYVADDRNNRDLKRCGDAGLPLVYLMQVKGSPDPEYLVFAPVWVVGWSDARRQFLIDLSERRSEDVLLRDGAPAQFQLALPSLRTSASEMEIRELSERYEVSVVQRRLREARFRRAVLDAYGGRCAVCGLSIRALLDAGRIEPTLAHGSEEVRDGIALCATHRRAFATGILWYDEKYRIRIRLPRGRTGRVGEKKMLLDYEGKRLRLPSETSERPRPMLPKETKP